MRYRRLSTANDVLLFLAAMALALSGAACGGGGGGGTNNGTDQPDVGVDMGQPDGGTPDDMGEEAALAITSPQSDALLDSPEVDVEVTLEKPDAFSEVALEIMGTTSETKAVEGDTTTLTFSDVDLSRFNATEDRVILIAVGQTAGGDELISEEIDVLVDTRRAAVAELSEASEREPIVSWDRDGAPAFIHMDIPAPEAEDPVEKGFQTFEDWKDLILVDDPRQVLAPGNIRETQDGELEMFFHQHLDGMPVASGFLALSFDETGERIEAFSGNYVPELPEPSEPEISKSRAEELAIERAVGDEGSRLFVSGHTRRVVFDPAIFDSDLRSDPTIAWNVHVQGFDEVGGHAGYWEVYVDAQSGETLLVLDEVRSATKDLRIKVLNAFGKNASDGASDCMSSFLTKTKPACFQNINFRQNGCNSNADADGDASTARKRAMNMHYWLKNHFGWITNEEGGLIKPIVNVTFDKGPNAQSMYGLCNKQLQFSDDWAVNDVVYHEFGHRLVRVAGPDFNYKNQSGALDEHYSDLFAALRQGKRDGDGFDHLMGENLPNSYLMNRKGNSLRNLKSPNTAGEPALYGNRYKGNDDKGGVHINSTIPSKATWLITKGGQFQGYDITALGPDKMRKVMWKTLRSSLIGSSTNFFGYANASINIARRTLSASDACQVRNAFAAVGIVTGDSDCDGRLNDIENDNDNDGTPDGSDNCTQIYNPSQKDTDGNGNGDACDPDNDGDGVADSDDNCPVIKNSGQTDKDGNGTGDMCEDIDGDSKDGYEDNCPNTRNLFQTDTDGDGKGDECDGDDDGDGVQDSNDNCPLTKNAGQADRNSNGTGDACDDPDDDGIVDANDPCPDAYSYPDNDRDDDGLLDACEDDDDDNDGVLDSNDNCRFVQNETQGDEDDDGYGDACDNCPQTENPQQKNKDGDAWGDECDPDDDGDGVPDEDDNCPLTQNAKQIDFDDNGVGSACEKSNYQPWVVRQAEALQQFAANFPGLFDFDPTDPDADIFTGFGMPIDVCKRAICRDPGYVPRNHEVTIELGANYTFRAAVVDGEGNVVEMLQPEQLEPGETTEFTGSITIRPPAGAFFLTDAVPNGLFQGTTYRLMIVGHPEFAYLGASPVTMQMTRGVPQ